MGKVHRRKTVRKTVRKGGKKSKGKGGDARPLQERETIGACLGKFFSKKNVSEMFDF